MLARLHTSACHAHTHTHTHRRARLFCWVLVRCVAPLHPTATAAPVALWFLSWLVLREAGGVVLRAFSFSLCQCFVDCWGSWTAGRLGCLCSGWLHQPTTLQERAGARTQMQASLLLDFLSLCGCTRMQAVCLQVALLCRPYSQRMSPLWCFFLPRHLCSLDTQTRRCTPLCARLCVACAWPSG